MGKRKREEDKQRFGCIYMLTNLITLLCYVGKSLDFKRRMSQHKHSMKKSNPKSYLSRSIQKHGWHNFKKEILIDDVPEEALNNLEIYYIAFHNTMRPYGYNLTTGGDGGWTVSEETRLNISKTQIHRLANRDRFGSVYFEKSKSKYVACGPQPPKKYIGQYLTKEKAEEALTHFLKTGERMDSDTMKRKRGTGTIEHLQKRYRAIYMKNKKRFRKTFDTPEQCEEWLKLKLNL
tara:strand:+ start:1273 stop:1974 length:702 start_codon:yes stop_codon:yes gene_type:complete